MTQQHPTLTLERDLFQQGHHLVAGLDEVGTGAPAGPCYCAMVVVSTKSSPPPRGVDDSKALTSGKREALVAPIQSWAIDWSIGAATAREIDEYGLTVALRLAGHRALRSLVTPPDIIILDGKRDWLSSPSVPDLISPTFGPTPPVVNVVRADRTCASVAAASILAKVARDALMVELGQSFPAYGWSGNKGYGTADHLAAIREYGYTEHHRTSWHLKGLAPPLG